jgi:hypothetical protein
MERVQRNISPLVTGLAPRPGAEVVLFPSAGYDARLMPARAADSGIALVAATHHDPAAVRQIKYSTSLVPVDFRME